MAVMPGVESGDRVYPPMSPETLWDWDGASPYARADGTTGAGVESPPGAGTDDPAWWEGLFGGVTGWLQAIWDRLGDLAELVEGIATDVAALPTMLADLFNPAVAWAAFTATGYPAMESEFTGTAPGCFLDAVADVDTLFTGSGEGISLTFGLPPNEAEVIIPYYSEVGAVTKPLINLVVVLIGFVWTFRRVLNPIPWNTQLRMGGL